MALLTNEYNRILHWKNSINSLASLNFTLKRVLGQDDDEESTRSLTQIEQ